MYHLIKDGKIIKSREELKGSFVLEDGSALSNIEVLTDDELKAIGWLKEITNVPEFDPELGYLSGEETDITSDNVFKTKTFVPYTTEEIASREQIAIDQKIAEIWQLAHDKETNAISGSAVGLLTLGVLQGKPKCSAVQMWIKDIWTAYYTAKAQTTAKTYFVISMTYKDIITEEVKTIDSHNAVVYNLEELGDMPYSVPELMEELGM